MPKHNNSLETLIEWALIAVVFFLPWQTRWIAIQGKINHDPWEYGTISIYGADIIILAFLIFTISYCVQNKKYKWSISHLLALFLLLVAFFSMEFAGDRAVAIFWWLKLAQGVAIFILLSQIKINLKHISLALITAGLIQSLLAYWQFMIQTVVSSKWLGMAWQDPYTLGVQVIQGPLGRVLRAYGSLPHPNMLGGLLVITLIACLMLYIQKQKKSHALFFAVSLPILSTALWMTFSRQAWIALACILLLLITYAFLTERTFPKPLAAGLAYLLLPMIIMTILFPSLINTRITAQSTLEQKSINERQLFIEQSRQVLKHEWISGVGIGNYTAYIATLDKKQNVTEPGYTYQPVHNVFLLVFTELGIFGLLAWLLFLLSLTIKIKLNNQWSLLWGLSVIALLIISVFDHYLWSLHFGILLFWITAGLLEQTKQLKNRDI